MIASWDAPETIAPKCYSWPGYFDSIGSSCSFWSFSLEEGTTQSCHYYCYYSISSFSSKARAYPWKQKSCSFLYIFAVLLPWSLSSRTECTSVHCSLQLGVFLSRFTSIAVQQQVALIEFRQGSWWRRLLVCSCLRVPWESLGDLPLIWKSLICTS